MLWKRRFLLSSLLCFSICFSQTQLGVGDISIIGIDCASEDFMFVTFIPLEEGTEIYFTDEEATGSYQIGFGEGTVLYTVPNGGISRGTVVSYVSNAVDFSTTSDGAITLANSGDGLIAYQGDNVGEVTMFLDAVGIDASSTGTFPDGFLARVLGVVNGQYQGGRLGLNQSLYVSEIQDLSKWQLSNLNVFPFDRSPFSFDTTPFLHVNKKEAKNLGYDFYETSNSIEILIEGENLTGDISITTTSNFEVSLYEEGPFTANLVIPAIGNVDATRLYVRLKNELNFSTFSGELIFSTAGVEKIEVDLIGSSRMGFDTYCNELFISEYIEGTSSNKFIEIYNPTIEEVLLTGFYSLEIYSNGGAVPSRKIDLVGNVASNEVFVIEHPSENLGVIADQQSGSLSFNGNDAVVLKKSGVVIDIVGQVGFDPGIAWNGATCSAGTQDGGIIRKPSVSKGNSSSTESFNIDEEWLCTSLNDISNLGIHVVDNTSKLTIWNGANWSNGLPDANDVAFIKGAYNSEQNGELETCMLFQEKDSEVFINESNPFSIHGDVVIKGTLFVDSSGTLIQTNNNSNFRIVDNGIAQLTKESSHLNNWYEYTYWSSPVTDIPIETALNNSPASRRFYFEATNFVDVLEEVGNTGVYNSGTDGIDDNGDDWQIATGIMKPGIGYAATIKPAGFKIGSQIVHFTGAFNNGIIEIPVVANSNGAYDDWNLIGNPYPGGLDAEKFLEENAQVLSGALYLWSHNTPPSSQISGNYGKNFSNSDYAIISGSGINVAGGDGIIPESYVPSCQGFFVEATNSGNVIFDNLMRVHNSVSNTQFFKSTNEMRANEPTAVWLDLTTDFGLFSQIAIGFFKEATEADDGLYFDVKRMPNSAASAALYSQIDNKNGEYIIQGRGLHELSDTVRVSLGITTNIASEIPFKISLARKKGLFSEEYPIFIYDAITNELVDLTKEEFHFTSQKGVVNERFELRFARKKNELDKIIESSKEKVYVRENETGQVQFLVHPDQALKRIEIYDVLGRRIYEFSEVDQSSWFDISKVKKGVYLSKVHLENNLVLFKKAIKRN